MERTELIPQTTSNLGTGQMYYHISLMHSVTNPPDSTLEHQIFFFESHFTELKYGIGNTPTELVWMVTEVQQWATTFVPGTWYNFAYDINISAGTVGLWASTGSDPSSRLLIMPLLRPPPTLRMACGCSRIVNGPNAEDWYVSGVYIESGTITTSIQCPEPQESQMSTSASGRSLTKWKQGPSQTTSDPLTSTSITPTTVSRPPSTTPTATPTTTTTIPSTTVPPTTTPTVTPTTTSRSVPISSPYQTQYGQCAGTGYTGLTTCASPYTCQAIAPPYYFSAYNAEVISVHAVSIGKKDGVAK
ncbi:hypothetical protein CPB84DRAFT_1411552 [Gymnopilus junonius]|uniref:CBM1 domain-containing protein n=1 Tax=Gymnopilus junonius TaxID=109634 RepID=A0A9P5NIH9_GYMJU|nr:hypothetical protein CPB84DRAFT_1411552 [Gymnopilus junonius]